MGGNEDLDIEVDVVDTSEPEDLASSANRYHHHRQDAGTGKQNGSAGGPSKKKRCRETVSASSEDGDRTPPPHESSPTTSKSLSTMLAKCTSPDLASTECYLESVSKELWSKFHELGTEMIITKTGRYVLYTSQFSVFNRLTDFQKNLIRSTKKTLTRRRMYFYSHIRPRLLSRIFQTILSTVVKKKSIHGITAFI